MIHQWCSAWGCPVRGSSKSISSSLSSAIEGRRNTWASGCSYLKCLPLSPIHIFQILYRLIRYILFNLGREYGVHLPVRQLLVWWRALVEVGLVLAFLIWAAQFNLFGSADVLVDRIPAKTLYRVRLMGSIEPISIVFGSPASSTWSDP